ncbi:MAG: hypothetical protein ACYS15_13285 [Planctomycetota bacterium]|jgi:hypothetical protein
MAAVLRRVLICGLLLTPGVALTGPAAAQTGEPFPYLAALTADDFVRAGADSRYYPCGRLRTGDVVKVLGEKAGWARVSTSGPAFQEFFAYIKYPKSETARFRLDEQGKSGTTTGPTDLFAPNLDAKYDPRSSWKPTVTLQIDRTLTVLETATYEDDIVHKVRLPADAEGWVALSRLRRAMPAEVAAWEAALAKAKAQKPPAMAQAAAPEAEALPQPPLGRVTPNQGATIEPDTPAAPAADATAEAPPAPKAKVPRRSAEARLAQIMLQDLEAAYARLLAEPIETAEVDPLRGLYLDLAKRHTDSRPIAQYAETRARQLALWAEVQQRKIELAALRTRARQTAVEAEESREVLESMQRYVAAGRLESSIIYDGKNLPKLFRIRNPETGRTLGYMQPDDRFDLAAMLGRRVGVVGERAYNGGLRLTLIKPQRIDALDLED